MQWDVRTRSPAGGTDDVTEESKSKNASVSTNSLEPHARHTPNKSHTAHTAPTVPTPHTHISHISHISHAPLTKQPVRRSDSFFNRGARRTAPSVFLSDVIFWWPLRARGPCRDIERDAVEQVVHAVEKIAHAASQVVHAASQVVHTSCLACPSKQRCGDASGRCP